MRRACASKRARCSSGSIELGEGVADLAAGDDRLEALDHVGQLAVVAGERRDLLRVVGDEHRSPELRLGGLLVDLEHELAGAVVVLHLHAVLGGDAAQLVDRHAHVDADAGVLLDEVDEAGPPPRRGEVELAAAVGELGRAVQLLGEVGGELLGERHHVRVVAVGLVELEHRELGVVAGRQPLVAEHPPDLEHLLEAGRP